MPLKHSKCPSGRSLQCSHGAVHRIAVDKMVLPLLWALPEFGHASLDNTPHAMLSASRAVMVALYLQPEGFEFVPPTAAACLQPRLVLEVNRRFWRRCSTRVTCCSMCSSAMHGAVNTCIPPSWCGESCCPQEVSIGLCACCRVGSGVVCCGAASCMQVHSAVHAEISSSVAQRVCCAVCCEPLAMIGTTQLTCGLEG